MKVVILGSGTLTPDPGRASPAHFVEDGSVRVLLDCGAETAASLARVGLPWTGLTHLFLSHFHTDHIGGLPALFWALTHGAGGGDHPRPLVLLGPPGVRTLMERLGGALGSFMRAPGRPLEVLELPRDGRWSDPAGGLELTLRPTPHAPESTGVRVETTGGSVGYTGDTGPDRVVTELLGSADVGIAECARPDDASDPHHLRPRDLADLLGDSPPGVLITVHAYPPLDPGAVPDLIRARGYTGRVRAGTDGMVVRVDGGRISVQDPDDPEPRESTPLEPAC